MTSIFCKCIPKNKIYSRNLVDESGRRGERGEVCGWWKSNFGPEEKRFNWSKLGVNGLFLNKRHALKTSKQSFATEDFCKLPNPLMAHVKVLQTIMDIVISAKQTLISSKIMIDLKWVKQWLTKKVWPKKGEVTPINTLPVNKHFFGYFDIFGKNNFWVPSAGCRTLVLPSLVARMLKATHASIEIVYHTLCWEVGNASLAYFHPTLLNMKGSKLFLF